ncbi:MAG: hypothetical protein ACI9F9_003280 [Candidatus Paceibacteria bacterium]|jgi:hypothetical protein
MSPTNDKSKAELSKDPIQDKPREESEVQEPKAKRPTATKPSDMSEELIEFITAMDEYKRAQQRPFPSLGEVFEVLKSLGYERPENAA